MLGSIQERNNDNCDHQLTNLQYRVNTTFKKGPVTNGGLFVIVKQLVMTTF